MVLIKKIIIISLLLSCVILAQENRTDDQSNSKNLKRFIYDKISRCTIRIEASNQNIIHIGTGFFFSFPDVMESYNYIVIVTNKHVIHGMTKGKFLFTSFNYAGIQNDTDHFTITIDNFDKMWIMHPDSNVDLAIMPIKTLIEELDKNGFQPFFTALDKNLIPKESDWKNFNAVEDILMVGYPIGLSDEVNNFPLFRRGITASHPAYNYKGKSEFIIDAACFPGSSGSPVFLSNISNNGKYYNRDYYFLGVFHSGLEYTRDGKIVVKDVPTSPDTLGIGNIPTNLGLVTKSNRILEFESILEKMLKRK